MAAPIMIRTYDNWKSTNPADEFLGPEPEEEEPDMIYQKLVQELLREALAEDARHGDDEPFDADGWSNYFLEDWKRTPAAVEDAWLAYQAHHHKKARP
jgi:hypothetical protein